MKWFGLWDNQNVSILGETLTISLSDAVVWTECDENPVLTFPIKKKLNTELFIDPVAALLIVN